jgi:hypothetical protein
MPSAPKDPKPNAAGCAKRKPFRIADFFSSLLEAIAVGVGRNRVRIRGQNDVDEYVRSRVAAFWQNPEVAEMSAPGLRGTVRLTRTIPFGEAWFNPNA